MLIYSGFRYSISPPYSAATNAAGKATMLGALGTVQRFASLGYIGGLVLTGPPYQLGRAGLPFVFSSVSLRFY